MAKSEAFNLQRLKEEQEKALVQTDNQIGQWKQFRSDYVALRDRLKTLPHKTAHSVMVPFGSLAFMPGQLVHTNELLVLLGDNYFMECSATQAADIVTRRVKGLDENIQALQKQREMLAPRTQFTSEMIQMAVGQGDEQEIREEYDEEKERLWRERHRESLRREGQRQMKAAAADRGREPAAAVSVKTDTDYWDILNRLEQQENEKQELEDSEEEEEEEETGHQPEQPDDADQSAVTEEQEDSSDDEEDDIADCRRKITFTHSKQEAASAAESADSSADAITSPADVYRLVQLPPRSILKTPHHTASHSSSSSSGGAARRASHDREKRVSFVQEGGGQAEEHVNASGEERRRKGGGGCDAEEETRPASFGRQTRVQAYSDTVVERELPSQYNTQQQQQQQPGRSEASSSASSPVSKPDSSTAPSRPMSRFRAAREKANMAADSQGATGSDTPADTDRPGCDVRTAARPVSKFCASRMKQGGGS